MQHLQPNTTLQGGKYRIERVLGQGGFGNTYVGINTTFEDKVAIKEFFMQGINDRDEATGSITISIERNKQQFQEQLEKFKKEALRIRKLDNPHIVRVHDFFEENGTAYYVMDYVDGANLAERLKKTGRPMTESEVSLILPQILDALKTVHDAGIWHLDLKPANIMLEKGGVIKLIDFGASKQLNALKGGATTSTAISYTNGYAPREQMEQNYDKFGPWTDIYALGATLYNLLTNKRPPLPTDIDDDISEDKHETLPFPEDVGGLKYLVLQMMKTNRLQRPQSVDEIIGTIGAAKTRKEESKQTSNTAKTTQTSSIYDDEATILTEPKSMKEEKSNGYEIVDLGLSVCWATMNIGASSQDEVGLGFIWGDSNGWIKEEVEKSVFNRFLKNYKPQIDIICGNEIYDTATRMWGHGWRMPTLSEYEELVTKCKWHEIDNYHMRVVGSNGKSLVFHKGPYWTGEKMEAFELYGKTKKSKDFYTFYNRSRLNHLKTFCLIRPVIDKKDK